MERFHAADGGESRGAIAARERSQAEIIDAAHLQKPLSCMRHAARTP